MQRLGNGYSRPRWSRPPQAPTQSTCGGHTASPLSSPHQAHNLRRGRGARHPGPASHDVRNIDGRIDEQRRRQRFCQHTRRGHDADLSNARMSGISRAWVDDVVVQQAHGGAWHTSIGQNVRNIGVGSRTSAGGPGTTHIATERCEATTMSGCTTTHECFTRCFTRARYRNNPSGGHSRVQTVRGYGRMGARHGGDSRNRRIGSIIPGNRRRMIRTKPAQRTQVIAGRRQGRHAARRQLHDARNRRGRAVRVAQSGAPRGPVGASPEHRHGRRPDGDQNAARPHGHRQVAAGVRRVPLRDAPQVDARERRAVAAPEGACLYHAREARLWRRSRTRGVIGP